MIKLKYLGPREYVSIVCPGRITYNFVKGQSIEIGHPGHVNFLLKSERHNFTTVIEPTIEKPEEAPKKEPEKPKVPPKKETKEKAKEKPKKGRKKK